MLNLQTLKTKVNALKAIIEHNSISPVYLGGILDEFIRQLGEVDPSTMSAQIQKALDLAAEAVEKAREAVATAEDTQVVAISATKNVLQALDKINDTIQTVNDANLRSIEAKEVADAAATLADEAKTAAVAATTSAQNAVATAADAAATAADAAAAAAAVQNSVGESEGIAPLDVFGKVPLANLPEISADTKPVILEFSGFEPLWSDDVTLAASVLKSTDEDCRVLFDGTHFFLKHEPNGQGPVMFWRWADAEAFGEKVGQGVNYKIAPRPNCIYVNKLTGEMYRVEGSALVPIASNMIPVTYDQLVELRGQEALKPGMWYRITDYVTTVANDPEARSVGNPFDVLVLATGPGSLSEEARAAHSERDVDGYFANANIDAWKVWYCLDNDTTRFQWADDDEGKGVIYRLIDEWNNDCPYDFKNIQFKRYEVDDDLFIDFFLYPDQDETPYVSFDGTLGNFFFFDFSNDNFAWLYTFTYSPDLDFVNPIDASVLAIPDIECSAGLYDNIAGCRDNSMAPYFAELCSDTDLYSLRALNNIVCTSCDDETGSVTRMHNNSWGVGCCNMSLNDHSYNNSFGSNCCNFVFFNVENCCFGAGCQTVLMGAANKRHTVGSHCDEVLFYEGCRDIVIGDFSGGVVFERGCREIIVRDNNIDVSFGVECSECTIGSACRSIAVGSSCLKCEVGNSCQSINIAYKLEDIVIGSFCEGVKLINLMMQVWINPYCKFLDVVGVSRGHPTEHVTVLGNTYGCKNDHNELNVANKDWRTFGINSNGDFKSWNPADLVE